MPSKITHYLFTIQSSRGTDDLTVKAYLTRPTKEQVKTDLHEWADKFGAMHVSENCVTLTSRRIEVPKNFKAWQKKWHVACRRYDKAKKERKKLLAIRNVPPCNKGGI